MLDHLEGGWVSPYVKLLTDIKNEVGMFRWPQSQSHIEAALAGHFLKETNNEIRRLSLPALEPLAKRARMQHVNESFESQVLSQWIVDQPLLGHKAPLLGDDGWRDRLVWCPACRGLLQYPVLMSSRHALYFTEFLCFYIHSV